MTREEKTNLKEKELRDELKRKKRKKLIRNLIIFFIIFVILIFMIVYYMRFYETKRLNVDEYKITSPKLSEDFNGFKIVHISDIHYKSTTEKKDLKRMVNEINELKPDIVVFTGDLLDKKVEYTEKDYKDITDVFKNIDATMTKYYIKGENDYIDKVDQIFSEVNFINLTNNVDQIHINNYINIYGYGSSIKKDFNYNNTENETFSISLIHEADNAKNIYNSDLILAGHSHNLQINIPYIKDLYTKKGSKVYYNKKYIINGTELYINPGIGTNGNKLRLFNPPTINFYRLEKENY